MEAQEGFLTREAENEIALDYLNKQLENLKPEEVMPYFEALQNSLLNSSIQPSDEFFDLLLRRCHEVCLPQKTPLKDLVLLISDFCSSRAGT